MEQMKEISIGGKRGKSGIALISESDFDTISQFHWFMNPYGYACRVEGKKFYFMHRQIMNTPESMQVDHINRNRLDNRRENLRNCTRTQNKGNIVAYKNSKSGYKGIIWDKERSKWRAEIQCSKKSYALGRFDLIEDAVSAYNDMAKKLFGEFALLNKIL